MMDDDLEMYRDACRRNGWGDETQGMISVSPPPSSDLAHLLSR